jgi:hypothetical protein
MLEVATPEHLPLVAEILAYGGRSGAWDANLGRGGTQLEALIGKLRYAFIHGVLPQVDPRTGARIETCIAGYVYRVDPSTPLIGFGLFKDFTDAAFELWMVGITEAYRARGHSRPMLSELLQTPHGRHAQLARCGWTSDGSRRCSHVLHSLGFASCRATVNEEWLLHSATPPDVAQMIRTMDMTPFEPRSGVGGGAGQQRA